MKKTVQSSKLSFTESFPFFLVNDSCVLRLSLQSLQAKRRYVSQSGKKLNLVLQLTVSSNRRRENRVTSKGRMTWTNCYVDIRDQQLG